MAHPPNRGKGTGLAWLKARVAYDGDDCLAWPLNRIRGYGCVSINGTILKAHRVMCEMAHGPAPEGHEAAHSCGNGTGGCCNPRHLSWKTPTANQADRKAHGRAGKLMPGRRYKLTYQQAVEIRSLDGILSQDELAARFGCTRENIGHIVRGKNWKHEPGKHAKRRMRGEPILRSPVESLRTIGDDDGRPDER